MFWLIMALNINWVDEDAKIGHRRDRSPHRRRAASGW
jgi:phosphopentomutase